MKFSNDNIIKSLTILFRNYGLYVLKNPDNFKNKLMEYAHESQKEYKLILEICKPKIVNELLDCYNKSETEKSQITDEWKRFLQEETFLSNEAINYGLEIIVKSTGFLDVCKSLNNSCNSEIIRKDGYCINLIKEPQEDFMAIYNEAIKYKGSNLHKYYSMLERAANNGVAVAQKELGVCYLTGQVVERNFQEALNWFRKAAEQNFPEAINNIGVVYESGYGVKVDFCEAEKWYKKAADLGLTKAKYNLADLYYQHFEELYLQSSKQSDEVSFSIHEEIINIQNPISYEQKAFNLFCEAAEEGFTAAKCRVAECYLYGYGINKNEEAAFKWYNEAAQEDSVDAMYAIGLFYQKGLNPCEHDAQKAFEYFKKSADNGLPAGMRALGYCYIFGEGVLKNNDYGLKLLLKAANHNDPEALAFLGDCYYYGNYGVERSYEKAFEYFQRASELGDIQATAKLGHCYQVGLGVVRDYEKAFELTKYAAEHGYREAVLDLADMFKYGQGVEKNPTLEQYCISFYDNGRTTGFDLEDAEHDEWWENL